MLLVFIKYVDTSLFFFKYITSMLKIIYITYKMYIDYLWYYYYLIGFVSCQLFSFHAEILTISNVYNNTQSQT